MKQIELIDSYGWIEYFGEGPLVDKYEKYICRASKENTVTPTIVLYEVYKKIKKEKSEDEALEAYAYIVHYTNVIKIDEEIALLAADVSLDENLSMADAIIKAVADKFGAIVVTSDKHFKDKENVVFVE